MVLQRRGGEARTLSTLVLSALCYATLQTMVAPALPAIQRDFGVSTTDVTWVLTIYLLSASVTTPLFGRIGDISGKKRMLVASMLALDAGLLLAAVASSLEVLVLARALQGASGAVFPLAIAIVRDEMPTKKVPMAIGMISASFGIGGALGLPLSGLLIDHLSYHWIFWFGLLQSSVATVAVCLFVRESAVTAPAPIDWMGAGLLAVGLSLLLVAVSEGGVWGWASAALLGVAGGGMAVLVVFWRHESAASCPIVDVRLVRRRQVWSTNLATLLLCVGMYGGFVLIPQLVQQPKSTGYGFGGSATDATLYLLPCALTMLGAAPAGARMINRFGPRLPLRLGLALVAAAFILLTAAHVNSWQLIVGSALMGAGYGSAYAAMSHVIVEAVPVRQTGEASAVNAIMRTLGGAVGAQMVAGVLNGNLTADGLPTNVGFTTAFGVCTIALVGALAAGFVRYVGPGTRRTASTRALDTVGPVS